MKNRLDPIRWSSRRRSRLVRGVLISALLVLAAGVLLVGTGPASASRCTPAPGPPDPTARPSPTGLIPPGRVGVPVLVSQPGIATLVRPGDHVELTAAATAADPADSGDARAGTGARVLVPDAVVLRAPAGESASTPSASMVYLAMTEKEARQVTATAPDARIAITVRPS